MKRFLAASATALLLVACASNKPVVQTDHAQGTDFSRYRTYTWAEQPQMQSPITRDKLVQAVDAQLAAKGWQRVPEGDVALVGQWVASEDVSYNHFSFGVGLGNWGGNSGGGVGASTGTSTPKTTLVGSLILDMYDAKTKQALWRGTISGNVPETPQGIDTAVATYIPQMFAKFPPP